ncbi:enolase C-terminal domain-like protein [Salinarchaeum laminariae]|uniref:enolase C-terminal domain-like protein n=1 Tax=Salinarchaeum laminariae TaxID=869888 RepID=UPI0020BDFA91|nr:enolase C-terminal domain-like protein [Salinarchaeum laminariae]
MEIQNADAVLTNPGRNYVIVRLETADGLVGWGDATLNGREKAVEAALAEHVFPELDGRDAHRIEDVWQSLYRGTYWRGGPVLQSALSGVDMALWDLKGKAAGLPVYDLLGGRTREYATVYDHCGDDSVDAIVANAEIALDRGIDHFRVNVGDPMGDYLDLDGVVEGVLEVRDRLGPDPELIVDVHSRASPRIARQIAQGLEPAELYFLEDPLAPEHDAEYEALRSATTTPIAYGELSADPFSLQPLVEDGQLDFLRVDLAHVGGITAARKLATVAEGNGVETAFHGPPDLSPIGQAATVHLDLALPNFGVQELTDYEERYGDAVGEVFHGGASFDPDLGGLVVPDEPGLGIDVDLDAAESREYERSHLPKRRAEDGSVADW